MENEPISLTQYVGQDLYAKIPDWKANEAVPIKLIGVEAGGIWIESQDFMEEFFSGTPHTMSIKAMPIFVPYSRILANYTFAQ